MYPLGPNKQPTGGYKECIEGSWIPILENDNDWVQLSRENTCVKYSYEKEEEPEWGI